MRALLALVLAAMSGAAACTLFDDDPPDDRCSMDSDCFRAQGEICDPNSHRCVVRDAGIDAP